MGWLSWIIVGLIAGLLAKWIMPGEEGGGIIVTILLGIIGAIAGGYVMSLLGFGGVSGINVWSIIVAVIGAIIVLFIYGLVTRRA